MSWNMYNANLFGGANNFRGGFQPNGGGNGNYGGRGGSGGSNGNFSRGGHGFRQNERNPGDYYLNDEVVGNFPPRRAPPAHGGGGGSYGGYGSGFYPPGQQFGSPHHHQSFNQYPGFPGFNFPPMGMGEMGLHHHPQQHPADWSQQQQDQHQHSRARDSSPRKRGSVEIPQNNSSSPRNSEASKEPKARGETDMDEEKGGKQEDVASRMDRLDHQDSPQPSRGTHALDGTAEVVMETTPVSSPGSGSVASTASHSAGSTNNRRKQSTPHKKPALSGSANMNIITKKGMLPNLVDESPVAASVASGSNDEETLDTKSQDLLKSSLRQEANIASKENPDVAEKAESKNVDELDSSKVTTTPRKTRSSKPAEVEPSPSKDPKLDSKDKGERKGINNNASESDRTSSQSKASEGSSDASRSVSSDKKQPDTEIRHSDPSSKPPAGLDVDAASLTGDQRLSEAKGSGSMPPMNLSTKSGDKPQACAVALLKAEEQLTGARRRSKGELKEFPAHLLPAVKPVITQAGDRRDARTDAKQESKPEETSPAKNQENSSPSPRGRRKGARGGIGGQPSAASPRKDKYKRIEDDLEAMFAGCEDNSQSDASEAAQGPPAPSSDPTQFGVSSDSVSNTPPPQKSSGKSVKLKDAGKSPAKKPTAPASPSNSLRSKRKSAAAAEARMRDGEANRVDDEVEQLLNDRASMVMYRPSDLKHVNLANMRVPDQVLLEGGPQTPPGSSTNSPRRGRAKGGINKSSPAAQSKTSSADTVEANIKALESPLPQLQLNDVMATPPKPAPGTVAGNKTAALVSPPSIGASNGQSSTADVTSPGFAVSDAVCSLEPNRVTAESRDEPPPARNAAAAQSAKSVVNETKKPLAPVKTENEKKSGANDRPTPQKSTTTPSVVMGQIKDETDVPSEPEIIEIPQLNRGGRKRKVSASPGAAHASEDKAASQTNKEATTPRKRRLSRKMREAVDDNDEEIVVVEEIKARQRRSTGPTPTANSKKKTASKTPSSTPSGDNSPEKSRRGRKPGAKSVKKPVTPAATSANNSAVNTPTGGTGRKSARVETVFERLKGPYVVVKGDFRSPNEVHVINSAAEELAEKAGRSKSKNDKTKTKVKQRGISDQDYRAKIGGVGHSSALSRQYDSLTADDTWRCVFCRGKSHCKPAMGDLFGPYWVPAGSVQYLVQNKTDSNQEEVLPSTVSNLRKIRKRKSSLSEPAPENKPKVHDDKRELGKEGDEEEVWFHEDCLCWVPGVYLLGSRIVGLDSAVSMCTGIQCDFCREFGASLGCTRPGCRAAVHVPCAASAKWQADIDTAAAACNNCREC